MTRRERHPLAYELIWAAFFLADALWVSQIHWDHKWRWLQTVLVLVATSAMWLHLWAAWKIFWNKPTRETSPTKGSSETEDS